jgi:15-cis-phytoene synthase
VSLADLAQKVEAGDPVRYLATMAAAPAVRAQLWPVYALNLELARAPWASAEPMVAEMRLQWWVDALEALTAGRHVAGISTELADLAEAGLDCSLLAAAAEARRWDCWKEPFEDQAAFDAHLDATSGHLMWAAAKLLGAPAAAEEVVRDHAWGAALAGWLTAVPELEARGRYPLVDGRSEAVAALAGRGLARLARARGARHLVPAAAAPALFPGWQAEGLLRQAAAHPARVADGALALSEFSRRVTLLRLAFLTRW